MALTKEEFDVYLAAYHAWRKATEEYYGLIVKIQQGDQQAYDRLQVLIPELDALHVDFMQKAKLVTRPSYK